MRHWVIAVQRWVRTPVTCREGVRHPRHARGAAFSNVIPLIVWLNVG